jgi:hypothetical protein
LDDRVHPEILVFVEDETSEIMLREIIASDPDDDDIIQRIDIVTAGPSNVVQMLGDLGREDKLPYESMAFVDGDMDPREGTIELPGNEAPEIVVYSELREADWPNLPERFGIGAGDLFNFLEEAMRNPDCHEWNTTVGDKIRKSGRSVWETLTTEWARSCLDDEERNRIVESVKRKLE